MKMLLVTFELERFPARLNAETYATVAESAIIRKGTAPEVGGRDLPGKASVALWLTQSAFLELTEFIMHVF